METGSLSCFLLASMLLTLSPGPDNVYVLTVGMTRGRREALWTAFGMCSGVSVHTAAAALGVSVIFYSSALAFNALKYLGAAYLLYLAWQAWRSPVSQDVVAQPVSRSAGALWRRGVLMNVLNPKVSLFFLAFLPQFVSVDAGSIPWQMMLLGMIFMSQALIQFAILAWFSAALGRRILAHPVLGGKMNRLTAAVLAVLGLRLATVTRAL
ncbi:MAG: LysE family translocator [Desulfuromonadaceae bacterium]|nr:LysE family translocator [Desulfuromonadaceae bacterium]